MASSVTSPAFTVDHLVSICEGTGELLVQQTGKILNLFKQISEGMIALPKQVSCLSWSPVSSLFFSEEGWVFSSSSKADIACFWKKGQESLTLQYDKAQNLIAQLQKEGTITNIPSEHIYIQWGKPFEELTPKLCWEGKTCQLYMFDCLGEKGRIFCDDKVGTHWTETENKRVADALKYYLKNEYQNRTLSVDKALQFRECCDAVCRIVHSGGTGTGFVIGNRLLITSHHVLRTKDECTGARAEFFYDSPRSEIVVVNFDPNTFFITSNSPDQADIESLTEDLLDFTIVALQPHPQLENVFAHPIRLDQSESAEVGKRVLLIHHPGGKEKAAYLTAGRNSRILRIEPLYLVHTADTAVGSSGAPLLSSSLKIMALHCQTLQTRPEQKIAVKTEAICSYLEKHTAGNSHWTKILTEFGPKEPASTAFPNSMYVGASIPIPPKDFTGRKKELTRLHEAFQHSSRVAVIGLGGVGKTTLSLQYAKEHRSEYQFIYFMPSGSTQLIIQGLIQLADNLLIPSSKNAEHRLQLLKIKLDRLEKKGLLIFDGVDQVEAFRTLERYLPIDGQHVLLTSRMPVEASIRNFEQIDLGPLLPDDAIYYLLRTTQSEEKEQARELSEKLGNLPLALTQAAGYIRRLNIGIQKYIEELDKSDVALFDDQDLSLKTILTAWKISIDEIEKTPSGALAKKVLDFFAFLGQAPIPLRLIENWLKTSCPGNTELDLLDALAQLCDYSMIDPPRSEGENPYFEAYNIHLLVQNVTRYQLLLPNKERVFEQVLELLAAQMGMLNSENPKDWPSIRILIPHAEIVIQHAEKIQLSQNGILFLAALSDSIGEWLVVQGNANGALEYFNIALKFRKKLSLKRDIDTAISYNNIGLSLRELGRYQEALENVQKALEIRRKALGEEHSDTAASYGNVSSCLGAIGRPQQALENAQKALEIARKIFGEEHADTAVSYSSVARSLGTLGRHQEALENAQKALEIIRKIFGEEHPMTATSYNNVGSSLKELGRHPEALDFLKKALVIRLGVFGEEHPMIAIGYNNIGSSLGALGRHQEALENAQKALEIRRKVLGEKHPDTAVSYDNIGSLLGELGRPQEGLKYKQEALEIMLKVFGTKHPLIAASYANVATSLGSLGRHQEALENAQKALEIMREAFGEEHPLTAASYGNVASSLGALGKHQEALENAQKSLKISRKVFGEEHPMTAIGYNNIGSSMRELGRYQEALENAQKSLKISRKVFGEEHPLTAVSYSNIDSSLRALGRYQEALENTKKVLGIRSKIFGEEHPDTAAGYNNFGLSLEALGKHQEALEYKQKALEIMSKVFGEEHPLTATSYGNVASSLGALGRHQEALEYAQKSLEIMRKVFGEEHPLTATSYGNIASSLGALGKHQEALECKQKALETRRKVFGEQHPITVASYIDIAVSFSSIGASLRRLGRHQETIPYLQKAEKIRYAALGPTHPDTIKSSKELKELTRCLLLSP